MSNLSLPRVSFSPAVATLTIIAASLCFGLVPVFVRELQDMGTGPATIALYRYGISVLVLLPFVPRARHKRGPALLLGAAGAVFALSMIGYVEAISVAPLAAAGVVYMSYPAFAAFFAWVLLKQALSWRTFAAAGLVIGAAALLLDPASLSPEVFAVLVWAIPTPVAFGFLIVVLSGLARDLSSLERAVSTLIGSILGLLPLALQESGGALLPSTLDGWWLVVLMGLITALIPQLMYTVACQKIGPMRTAAAGSFELPTMFLVGWFVFGEKFGVLEMVCALLVLSAILVAPAPGARPERAAQAVPVN
ncbi:DMT family transporter [uncultured Roseibium sp.]|uniref:DMT family transporter n=1 Tax=uncultured Roseibium sp. TaxID=1936171 RepID=UPI0026170489|nr:DMT family transporter [uncultured Roseibium sp.]